VVAQVRGETVYLLDVVRQRCDQPDRAAQFQGRKNCGKIGLDSGWRFGSVGFGRHGHLQSAWFATSLCQSVGRYPPPHGIWSHEVVVLNGVTVTVKVAHVRLCHSRMPFVRAYPRETQEMVFDAHDWPLNFCGTPITRGNPDGFANAL
jgi:hypothetical protein